MTCFEVFTMMFYALDSQYDHKPGEELGEFLSSANPFLFEDSGSADSAVYLEFKDKYTACATMEPDGYAFVKRYISELKLPEVSSAFKKVSYEDWLTASAKYQKSEHKME